MQNGYPKDLPAWLWLWLPIVVALFPYVMRLISIESDAYVYGEQGIIENYTFMVLFFAIVLGMLSIPGMNSFAFPEFRYWLMLLVLGCIYYAGEEASWGQHWFGWGTPEGWMSVNDQGETNLHNTSALLDQLPRMLLTIAAVVGGILIPAYFLIRRKRFAANEFWGWLWPSYVNIPTCLLALLVSWHAKIYKILGTDVPDVLAIRAGETKESLLATFLLMYVASFYKRLKESY